MFTDLTGIKTLEAWSRVASAIARLTISSAEVIARRGAMMAQGAMSAPEAAQMMMEKPAAFATSAQRAIQFVRSTPGLTTALIGMKRAAHVEENLALAQQPLLSPEHLAGIFDRSQRR